MITSSIDNKRLVAAELICLLLTIADWTVDRTKKKYG